MYRYSRPCPCSYSPICHREIADNKMQIENHHFGKCLMFFCSPSFMQLAVTSVGKILGIFPRVNPVCESSPSHIHVICTAQGLRAFGKQTRMHKVNTCFSFIEITRSVYLIIHSWRNSCRYVYRGRDRTVCIYLQNSADR